jgi:pyridinium-3,5-bisthiocarboxylic acid mononucleotide nickel chelatase
MPGYETDTVTRIETNLDDVSPQVLGTVMQQLLAAGALDVWFTPVQMKKSRPGTMLCVLCEEGSAEKIADIIFTETTAFGLRVEKIARLKLTRRFETVKTSHGEVTVKLGFKGEQLLQIAPEFESCRVISERSGVPLREVQSAAMEAARTAFCPKAAE